MNKDQKEKENCKIGSGGSLDGVPYFAVGNNELEKQPKVSKTCICPNCKKKHKIDYGKDVKTGEVSTILAFVNCPKSKSSYLVAVNQKII